MKRLVNLFLLLSFQFGYLEWGRDRHMFVYQVEAELFSKACSGPESFLHPFIIVPLCGQVLLLVTLFQRRPGRILSLAGLTCLSLLMILLLFIGLLSLNYRILLSVLPFLVAGFFVVRYNRKQIRTN